MGPPAVELPVDYADEAMLWDESFRTALCKSIAVRAPHAHGHPEPPLWVLPESEMFRIVYEGGR